MNNWTDVRVIGEHTVSAKNSEKFLQLARYARNVFKEQPQRQFLHGFILFRTTVELHLFDRSGTFSAEQFDINKEPERFIRVLTGYCLMSDEELGLDTYIERDADKEFVTIVNDVTGKDTRLQLETRYIAQQAAIACRGTSCYRTTDGAQVVKFSWMSATRWLTEPDILKAALKSKAKGVARLVGHRRIISTGELREGLIFKKRRPMINRSKRKAASFSGQLASLPLSDEPGTGGERRSSNPDQGSQSKRSRSSSRVSKLSQVHEAGESFTSQMSQSSRAPPELFVDRVLSCLAISPAGRPLHTFATVPQLLRALRDAIRAHRSLFLDGKILHRDISNNNIIITNPKENDGFSGMLIDMDLAATIDAEGNKRMTGTLKFMAIEVLELALRDMRRDLEHTYRHDLESFFYVLLDVCMHCAPGEDQNHTQDRLSGWYTGSFETIAKTKASDMSKRYFSRIVGQFLPPFDAVKGLAENLRTILFGAGELDTRTPETPSPLYERIINEFNLVLDES